MTKIALPIKVVTRGKLTTGPKPGTPEYEQEQAERRAKEQANGDPEPGGEKRGG
jgi:hypothetical protein